MTRVNTISLAVAYVLLVGVVAWIGYTVHAQTADIDYRVCSTWDSQIVANEIIINEALSPKVSRQIWEDIAAQFHAACPDYRQVQ